MRIQRLVGAAVLLVAAAACGGGSSATGPGGGGGGGGGGGNPYNPPGGMGCTPSGTTVCMTLANTFNPATLTVARGTAVTWDNQTSVTHNVTFDTQGSPSSITDFSSGTRSATFPNAGTFDYHCSIHGQSMSGSIVVQ